MMYLEVNMGEVIGFSSYPCARCHGETPHKIIEQKGAQLSHVCVVCEMQRKSPFEAIPDDLVRRNHHPSTNRAISISDY